MAVEKVNKIPRDDAIDQFIHLFRRSIARRLPKDDDSVVPLSGGRDSRHILLELVQQGRKPKFCITYEQFAGKSFGEDVRVAAALCRELEIKHVCLNQTEKYSAVEIRKNYHTNFCSDKHQQMYVLAEYLADSTEVLYDGLAGDTLSKSNYPSLAYVELYRKQKYEELAIDCFRRYSCDENDFRRFFHKQFYAKINFDQAIAALASELKKYAAAADPFTAFRFWNRTRRDIALLPYRVLERVPTVFTPYLDHELFRFLSSLPGDMAGDREFHTDSIRRAYPRHAHIPFENEGPKKSPAILDKKTAEINRGVAFYYLSRFKFRGSIFDTNYLLPRMMRCLCSTKYAASLNWLPMPRVLFLTQLADFVEKPYRLA
ncbi:MAG: asparagine synthase-related protein [Candidatus Omnitrophota bacterium]|nr:asparagine synthase-related protein [Candidatus Omnitrophota bacterium]